MKKEQDAIPSSVWVVTIGLLILNLSAYVLGLWQQWWWFDDLMHLLTPFSLVLMIGFYLYGNNIIGGAERWVPLVLILVSIGLTIGFLWEVLEWVVRLVRDGQSEKVVDTTIDLVLDTTGSLIAAVIATKMAFSPSWRPHRRSKIQETL